MNSIHVYVQDVGRMLSLATGSIQELSKSSPDQGLVDHKTKEFVKVLEVTDYVVYSELV